MEPIGADHPQWRDWRWQMQHRIRTEAELARYIRLTEEERQALERTRAHFQWGITPYYAALMDPEDPQCPVRRQVVPRMAELDDPIGLDREDPLAELEHAPVKNLIHVYRDRVAFCVTAECALYCRYCLRKRMVGDPAFFLSRAERREAIAYVAAHPEIRDVLLTGGDPLSLGDEALEELIRELRAIPHVELIRLGTRYPVTLPYRITEALLRRLEPYHPIWVNTHFNCAKEITPDAAEAVDRLLRHGFPVGNQSVLLRGINDTPEQMRALLAGLVRSRVRPYYLYQAQLVGGTAHFRTSIERGLWIMRELQGRITGFAIPRYVLDTPFGKVPLTRDYILGRSGDYVAVRAYDGRVWLEYNPLAEEDRDLPVQLPSVEIDPSWPTYVPAPAKPRP
ncbi:MAG: KamA family radical SAM protein [Bacteroidetes bacterium]|nr:KamA family radical SAM protein [Rhodothermia bacterium]MCS7154360.1 KamA family radical SAM protein [Bacteroidota bacterium]MCX7907605.1 KamA family radical SAM protein [Bacteroidota bacterium]MDW8137735.1 KamA family radical SAM protein [Bacteroidota bacterium]MDW8286432.1 KamA family radical SAM protein [Bacteroidota bacterium]